MLLSDAKRVSSSRMFPAIAMGFPSVVASGGPVLIVSPSDRARRSLGSVPHHGVFLRILLDLWLEIDEKTNLNG